MPLNYVGIAARTGTGTRCSALPIGLLRSYDDAQDIVQTVFIAVWEKRNALIIRQSFESYLFQSVRFQSLKKLESLLSSPQQLNRVRKDLLPAFNDILGL